MRYFHFPVSFVGPVVVAASLSFVFITCALQKQIHPATWIAPQQSSNYPDLSKHNNWMAKCLTEGMYLKLKDKVTKNGVTLDKCIQTGLSAVCLFSCQKMQMCAVDSCYLL